MTSSLVFDLEAYVIDGAAAFLEPPSAPSNYRDEAKIIAYIEQANREQLAKAALDVDLARIVCLGTLRDEPGAEVEIKIARDEQDERELIEGFWGELLAPRNRPTIVGFNCLAYDLPMLLRRSLYHGIPAPRLPINKYRHDGIEDLMLALSFDGALKYRGLDFYVRRFALDVPAQTHTGADIAALVECAEWGAITTHCEIDVLGTAALARRLGLLRPAVAVGVF